MYLSPTLLYKPTYNPIETILLSQLQWRQVNAVCVGPTLHHLDTELELYNSSEDPEFPRFWFQRDYDSWQENGDKEHHLPYPAEDFDSHPVAAIRRFLFKIFTNLQREDLQRLLDHLEDSPKNAVWQSHIRDRIRSMVQEEISVLSVLQSLIFETTSPELRSSLEKCYKEIQSLL
jgi:hypothetical protein